MDRFEFFSRKCPLFSGKNREELEILLRDIHFFSREYYREEIVALQGRRAEFLGIVEQGKVEVQKVSPAGGVITLTALGEGETFGEAVLFSRWQTYPATVAVREISRIIFFHREQLLEIFSRDREVLIGFMENISDRMLLLAEKIDLLSQDSVRKRVVSFLLAEAERQQKESFHLSLNRRKLAEHLNLPRPSLSRELGKLKEEGYIDFAGKSFSLNIKELKKILGT